MSKRGIEYADLSWNPSTGCLMTGCKVGKKCWAYRMSLRLAGRYGYPPKPNSFQPTFHPDKLDIPLKIKKRTRFDSCFMSDIAYAKKIWLQQILDVVERCPQHIFYFLTKRPELLAGKELIWPDNAWVGVSVNTQDDVWRIGNLKQIDAKNLWVSFEPLYGLIMTSLADVRWVVLGAQTNPEFQPEKRWANEIIHMAKYHSIPIFVKPNLTVIEPRLELPEAIKRLKGDERYGRYI